MLGRQAHGPGAVSAKGVCFRLKPRFEVDANGEKRRLSQFEIDRTVQQARYPDKHEFDKQKIETKNGWKIYPFTVRSTRTEEKPKDVFESGDKEKLDTFTEM